MTKTVLAQDLAPGQVIQHEQGNVEVLTAPELNTSDGRVYFDAKDAKSRVQHHRAQPTFEFEVQS